MRKRRHWDDREFDEYIVNTEGLLPYQTTPEDIVCQRKTLTLQLSILDTCTPVRRERFLLYALYDYTYDEIGLYMAVPSMPSEILSRLSEKRGVYSRIFRSFRKRVPFI